MTMGQCVKWIILSMHCDNEKATVIDVFIMFLFNIFIVKFC